MFRPSINSRIEQRHDRLSQRINSREVRSLLAIAFGAAKDEILTPVITTMLGSNGVVILKVAPYPCWETAIRGYTVCRGKSPDQR